MQSAIERVEIAIRDLKQGKMIILTDDPTRENEGDLIVAAEKITPEIMNFMIRHGTGIVCLPLSSAQLSKLNLSLMVASNENTCARGTQFTLSIDAKTGISTGVSAADRTRSVQVAISDDVHPDDLVKPGHIFPLLANDGGVLARQGHTEGAVDLAHLAGFKPAAVLCEIMNPDGTMAHTTQLEKFATTHQLTLLSISDIIMYRLLHENMIADEITTTVPLSDYGSFTMTVIKEKLTAVEHIVLVKDGMPAQLSTLVRIHSACTTGDLFASERCDCNKQLHHALRRISDEGGMLIYLNQEGRGIGLFNKIKAYALQDHGMDTVTANEQLGLPIDSRNYHIAANILRHHNIRHVRLLTNNPDKINDLIKYGIPQVEREIMPPFQNIHNQFYLKTKRDKLHHTINNLIAER